MIIGHI